MKYGHKSAKLNLLINHQVIKAGFLCISPSFTSRIFLRLFEIYSIGNSDCPSPIYHRLFSFYYGDQISLLNSIMELKNSLRNDYYTKVSWLDLEKSKIVSVNEDLNPCVFLPKGSSYN